MINLRGPTFESGTSFSPQIKTPKDKSKTHPPKALKKHSHLHFQSSHFHSVKTTLSSSSSSWCSRKTLNSTAFLPKTASNTSAIPVLLVMTSLIILCFNSSRVSAVHPPPITPWRFQESPIRRRRIELLPPWRIIRKLKREGGRELTLISISSELFFLVILR